MKKILMCWLMLFSMVWAKDIRLVVLDPASIETLYLLGAESSIVGIAKLQQSGIYPEEKTKNLTDVGTFSNPNIEKIVLLKPTLVILSSYSVGLQDRLKEIKIPTLFMEASSLNQIRENIVKLAKAVGREKEGEEVLATFNAKLEKLAVKGTKKKGLFLYSSNPLMAFGSDTLVSDVLDLLGIKSIVGPTGISRPILSPEHVVEENPEVIIYGISVKSAKELLEQQPALKNTQAFKDNQLYSISAHTLLRGSPIIADRMAELKDMMDKVHAK